MIRTAGMKLNFELMGNMMKDLALCHSIYKMRYPDHYVMLACTCVLIWQIEANPEINWG